MKIIEITSKTPIAEEQLDELNWKHAVATGALAASAVLGNPASAQDTTQIANTTQEIVLPPGMTLDQYLRKFDRERQEAEYAKWPVQRIEMPGVEPNTRLRLDMVKKQVIIIVGREGVIVSKNPADIEQILQQHKTFGLTADIGDGRRRYKFDGTERHEERISPMLAAKMASL